MEAQEAEASKPGSREWHLGRVPGLLPPSRASLSQEPLRACGDFHSVCKSLQYF